MLGNPNILNVQKRFSSEHQPKKNGRKKSVLIDYMLDADFSKDDVKKVAKWILNQDIENIKKYIQDPQSPIIVVGFCNSLLKDLKSGNTNALDRLITWAFGAPDQKVTTEGTVTQTVVRMSYDERKKKKEEILAKQGYIKADITEEDCTIPNCEEIKKGENDVE